MADFSHLGKLKVEGKTAEFTLYDIDAEPRPVLTLKPGGQANAAYFNEMLRNFQGNERAIRSGQMTAELLAKQLEFNRRAFPRHVVVGWKHMPDASGNPVAFSVSECEELFRQMPDFMIHEIRDFVENPRNFLAGGGDLIDVEALAGN